MEFGWRRVSIYEIMDGNNRGTLVKRTGDTDNAATYLRRVVVGAVLDTLPRKANHPAVPELGAVGFYFALALLGVVYQTLGHGF